MLPVASARPLWWLARWATRLLTGFAVAAAFTLGAWAMPAQSGPAGHPAVDRVASSVLLAQSPHAGWQPTSSGTLVAVAATGVVDRVDPVGVPGLLPEARPEAQRPAATAVAGPATSVPTTVAPAAHGARAPPGA
ncbi:hypothetical protein ACIBO1_15390 [Micromonospora sp. NPDC049903]|uniref:hypothetical protein n=1 Tax=Micromonospora sp. NPDC049903 TaxID=3364276 RepID=UPI0037A9EA98